MKELERQPAWKVRKELFRQFFVRTSTNKVLRMGVVPEIVWTLKP